MLIINRPSRTLGSERLYVLDGDGRPLGELRGGTDLSFHAPDGSVVGRTRLMGGRYTVSDSQGREAASMRVKSDADNSRMWLDLPPACPEPLRALALALPIAVRISRQS